ncbi:hypothetical protein HYQ45_014837 [Verticillium longisporum]|uniref:Uncharacterized protein n=1 Tax=Verticillium longisporum TaxID=100787 RepID=A0A8I3AJJ6_VERLO|nr:hypothetical protein HYQ45_014837 [Verticillium longisporum]
MAVTPPEAPTTQAQGAVPKTQYATAYESRYTKHFGPGNQLYAHVNCGYLSTPGRAPTLLALKQHAQSLAILIKNISVSTAFGEVDNRNRGRGHTTREFRENEAFDWLNDLSRPYTNADEWHQKPLTELMNQVEGEKSGHPHHHCPLSTHADLGQDKECQRPRPYATHHALTMHANECLEMLDHEYSATGGLMSLLPTDAASDSEMLQAARNTLLGQWLVFNQHLVGRMHELEIAYGNSLDALRGEAVVPMQNLSMMAPHGAGASSGAGSYGREIAYPQDRWILCNAGDDVFEYVHKVLDRQEALIEPRERAWREHGVTGERMWQERRGGEQHDAGLVVWDVKTRYIRLRGKARTPIFVIPAHGEHPGVAETRRLEAAPGVVSVVTPTWPARVSDWEQKFRDALHEGKKRSIANFELRAENDKLREKTSLLEQERQKLQQTTARYEQYYSGAKTESEVKAVEVRMQRMHDDFIKLRSERDATVERATATTAVVRRIMQKLEKEMPAKYIELMKAFPVGEEEQEGEDEDEEEGEQKRAKRAQSKVDIAELRPGDSDSEGVGSE